MSTMIKSTPKGVASFKNNEFNEETTAYQFLKRNAIILFDDGYEHISKHLVEEGYAEYVIQGENIERW